MKTKLEKLLMAIVLISISGIFIFLSDLKIENENPNYKDYFPRTSLYQDLARVFNHTEKYLINTPSCKIPYINPFIDEVEKFFHHEEYAACSDIKPLSYISKEDNHYSIFLKINKSITSRYSHFNINCCYSIVTRVVVEGKPENQIEFSDCVDFEDSVEIVDAVIKVTCKNSLHMKIYSNIHAIISPIHLPSYDINTFEMMPKPKTIFNVLIVGIDSISKLNLIRTMPKTFNFLESRDFVNLKGYTKVGDNTLPNLWGILSGLTMNQIKVVCDYKNNMSDCPNIWNDYKKLDYVTAYAEDSSTISSFNYESKGFVKVPTDFYFRPYILAAETLKVTERGNMYYCAGPETEAERIMNLVKDFQITFKNYPKFGLFWMNSFSHDDLNMPSAMDEKVENFLHDLYKHLNKTIFFFISDHGIRFGDIRKTQTGWLEERIPFFYVHVPSSFKKQYPKWYKNLLINSERLTSAYDIYMTLQSVLQLADKKYSIKPSKACPKCHSLFNVVSDRRTCYDAGIVQRWCVCNIRQKDVNKEPAQFFIDEINKLVKNYQEGYKCHQYTLDQVIFSDKSTFKDQFNNTKISLLLRITTHPYAIFEGLIQLHSNGSEIDLLGDVSRLNRYAPYTTCIENSPLLEKYCYCYKPKSTIFSKISKYIFNKN